jgi:hypothetical protein
MRKPIVKKERVYILLVLTLVAFLVSANLPESNSGFNQLSENGTAPPVSSADTTYATTITNGDFSRGFKHWNPSIWGDAKGAFTIEKGMAKLQVDSSGTFTYNIMLYQGVALEGKSEYTIEFDIKSEQANRPFEVVMEHYGQPYNKYLWEKCTTSTNANELKHFEIKLKMDQPDPKTKLGFHFGSQQYGTGTVWIGNISIKR